MLLLLIMYTAQKCARSAQKVGRLGGSTLVPVMRASVKSGFTRGAPQARPKL